MTIIYVFLMSGFTAPTTALPVSRLQLLVCLGNPGNRYQDTRHNAGFLVAERLLACHQHRPAAWQPGNGRLFLVDIGPRQLMLLKPMTYMNSSGEAVNSVARHVAVSPGDMLVVCDCLDLPLGRLRMRKSGSSGGQKGLASIIQELGSQDIPRLRVGIGRPQSTDTDIIDYVLAPWASAEKATVTQVVTAAANMVALAFSEGLDCAMNRCNAWSADNINAIVQGETDVEKV
ncbi:MAG: aminoacyl-tRNA hydrolase [Lentisphaerae bacterium]|nr:aminoacyl-tRNA hydrolase [Lentisphaerota bacterium]